MKLTLLVLMGASILCAQNTIPLTVLNPGNALCTGTVQHDDSWKVVNSTGDVQVAQKMTCNLFISSFDQYIVVVKTFEPLQTIGIGQRVFTITVNGQAKTVDLKRLTGGNLVYDVSFLVAAEHSVTITFESSVRTALWSQIVISRTYSNVLPIQIQPTAIVIPSTLPLGVPTN